MDDIIKPWRLTGKGHARPALCPNCLCIYALPAGEIEQQKPKKIATVRGDIAPKAPKVRKPPASTTRQRTCVECSKPFEYDAKKGGRDPVACSPECKLAHKKRYMREYKARQRS